jgi:RNA polymerase sigma-70 factor (family 1)
MKYDRLLADLTKQDDVKAFNEFFDSFYPSVCIFANKYLNDINLSEDFAQEAFIEFWKRKENFDDFNAIKGFIYTVTRNKCLNNIKLKGIRERILSDDIFTEDYCYDLVLEEETYREIYLAVDKLAPQSRKIVWLSMDGNKNQDIADCLAISINTVKTLKKNAYKKLRVQLEGKEFLILIICLLLDSLY